MNTLHAIKGHTYLNKPAADSRFFRKISHNAVMIYNIRNRRNDATESQKEKKTCFNAYFQYSQSKITD